MGDLGVSTHTMLRAALKPFEKLDMVNLLLVSTHTMLRAALKLSVLLLKRGSEICLDTHNAACGIETK